MKTIFLKIVSLAYEKVLLPDTYNSEGGEKATREHFAKMVAEGMFCSINADAVVADPKWDFLYEDLDEEVFNF